MVSEGSLKRLGGTDIEFVIGDGGRTINVSYNGLLPDLFREGQGVVAEGKLDPGGRFIADTVLAKHDETYMPREVADSLKKQGVWRGDGEPQAKSSPK
jgi:cytochrome c-type biogenesis protein CcmE